MTLKVRAFSPARVPKLNVRLLRVRRQLEGDFSPLPLVRALAFRGFPDNSLSCLKYLDVEFLAEARFIEPKFKRVPDLGAAASRIRCPPLGESVGFSQSVIDVLRCCLNADLMINSVAHLAILVCVVMIAPCLALQSCLNFSVFLKLSELLFASRDVRKMLGECI